MKIDEFILHHQNLAEKAVDAARLDKIRRSLLKTIQNTSDGTKVYMWVEGTNHDWDSITVDFELAKPIFELELEIIEGKLLELGVELE